MFDPNNYPDVPEDQRPKRLFVNQNLDSEIRTELTSKGWIVTDTRLLPNHTDNDRLEVVKSILEGIRQGSIDVDRNIKDFLDMELYVLGVKGKGAQAQDKGDLKRDELDVLLDFGNAKTSQDFKEKLRQLDSEPKKKTKGRPKKL
jgi:hypothetical protein